VKLEEFTATAPMDCEIPIDRLTKVPIPRGDSDEPTPLTGPLIRHAMSLRMYEVRQLEIEGPIPKNPEKVKELHHFAINLRKALPDFYRSSNPNTKWDAIYPWVPTNREFLSLYFNLFLMTLHRPYIFSRVESQRQVYECSLYILDSQENLYEMMQTTQTRLAISIAFPTFDAAVTLAIVLISDPERYRESFQRPYQSLQKAHERLEVIGPKMQLAATGAEILKTVLQRVWEAQESRTHNADQMDGENIVNNPPALQTEFTRGGSITSATSSDNDPWQFQVNHSAMDWVAQYPEYSDFDFSNLQAPVPMKELLLDDHFDALSNLDTLPHSGWSPPSAEEQYMYDSAAASAQQSSIDPNDNPLWYFLTESRNTNEFEDMP
jgi:hypothetical protein